MFEEGIAMAPSALEPPQKIIRIYILEVGKRVNKVAVATLGSALTGTGITRPGDIPSRHETHWG